VIRTIERPGSRRQGRSAEADLGPAAVHRVGRHAEDANPCEQQGEDAEEAREHGEQAIRNYARAVSIDPTPGTTMYQALKRLLNEK